MKNNYKKQLCKILAVFIGITAGFSSMSACNLTGKEEIPVSLPVYANDRELNLYGYVNPTNGDYTFDSIPMNGGTDFRTVENFKDYMDAGFNIAFARYDGILPMDVTKETWPQSNTKIMCDVAYEAGLRKILITDQYFDRLVRYTGGNLIGEGATDRYKTEAEMDADILERLSIYKDTPGFYGLILLDEPLYEDFKNYALVHKSIKRVLPETYIHNNLHYCYQSGIDRYTDVAAWVKEYGREPTLGEAYKDYLDTFLALTEAENLAVDIYPFCDRAEERIGSYFWNIQVLREACDKYGAKMSFVMQSISFTEGEIISKRTVNINDMWLQMNALLGYGVDTLAYYTYFPYPSYGSDHTVLGTFIDWEGNKTSVYYNGAAVNNAVRKFDEILLHYEFQGGKMHLNSIIQNGGPDGYVGRSSTTFDNTWEHTLLTSLTQNNDALLVTELKDKENDLYMYMIMNAIDSLYSQNGKMGSTECTFTAEFEGYDYVAEFDCGELRYVKLDNGKYTKTLSSGFAVYLVPLKVA